MNANAVIVEMSVCPSRASLGWLYQNHASYDLETFTDR